METKTKGSFEHSLKALEKIVEELEKGDLPLEQQLKSFEKGVSVSRDCLVRLDEVERRVQKLVQTPKGELKASPFEKETTV